MKKYAPAKTGEYPRGIPTLKKKIARVAKKIKDNKHKSLHMERKYVPQNWQVSSSHARIPNSWDSGVKTDKKCLQLLVVIRCPRLVWHSAFVSSRLWKSLSKQVYEVAIEILPANGTLSENFNEFVEQKWSMKSPSVGTKRKHCVRIATNNGLSQAAANVYRHCCLRIATDAKSVWSPV